MANCESKGFSIKAAQIDRLKQEDIIAISVTDDLKSCSKIDTRTIDTNSGANIANLAAGYYYNAARTPEDAFGCSKNSCFNTGTFLGEVEAAETTVQIGDFKKTMDATLYATGIVTAYVMLPEGEHTVSLDLASYTATDWTNYDEFTTTVYARKGADYLYPVRFDLTEVAKTEGSGWTLNTIGVKARILIDGANLEAGNDVGVSSIAFYESIEDLEIDKTILATCADTWGDNQSFDVIENACSTSNHDSNSGTMTFSMTVNKISDSYGYINPTFYKTDDTTFGVLSVVTRTVQAGTGALDGYGFIQLSDIAEDECGFMYVQTPGCANNSSELQKVSSPVPAINPETDTTKYQLLTSDYQGDESLGLVLVAKEWIGQELNIVYRRKATAEIYEITNQFRDFHCRILAPLRKKDGTVEWHLYEDALVTSMANNISRSDNTTIDLEFTIAADENGVRKKIVKITD